MGGKQTEKNKTLTVVVGLSGGVDSSVAAFLLKQNGFNVVGLHMKNASEESVEADEKLVREICEKLGIECQVVEYADEMQKVKDYFVKEYSLGRTPNPCVVCNPLVKLKSLCDKADEMGIFHVATGHYAQIVEEDGIFYVKKAANPAKDQSYMLHRLPQNILKRLVLPLGQYEKPAIRAMARRLNSSGCGLKISPVLSPASIWKTRFFR